jgi:hypothetical protein
MPVKRSKKLAILERRRDVADLYLQGWTQMEIAARLGVAQATISEDLSEVRRQWRESAMHDFELARQMELRKLDRLEREAWAAWERSQKPAQSAVISGAAGLEQTRKSVKHQHGDPRFLDLVSKCIGHRRALLGLDIPIPTSASEADPDANLPLEQRQQRVVAIFAALRQREGTAAIGTEPGGGQPGDVRRGHDPGEVEAGPAPDPPRSSLRPSSRPRPGGSTA